MYLSTLLLSLLASIYVSAVESIEFQAPEANKLAVEAQGCPNAGKPSCLNPIVHYQNYQDVFVDVEEFYNYETSFPVVGPEPYAWTFDGTGGATYNQGLFYTYGGFSTLTRNSPLELHVQEAYYVSAQMDFNSTDPVGVESPLGIDSDPFYGYGFLRAYDLNVTGLEFGFVLTNTVVYATYGRDPSLQTPENNYLAFLYLIPIMTSLDNSIYTMIFNRDEMSVSWMVDGIVKLLIPTAGKPIDSRFMIEDLGGVWPNSAFPSSVTLQMGIARFFNFNDNLPHTACQEAIFNYCDRTQSIFNAVNVNCTYEPAQLETFSNEELIVSMFQVVEATNLPPACSCPIVV